MRLHPPESQVPPLPLFFPPSRTAGPPPPHHRARESLPPPPLDGLVFSFRYGAFPFFFFLLSSDLSFFFSFFRIFRKTSPLYIVKRRVASASHGAPNCCFLRQGYRFQKTPPLSRSLSAGPSRFPSRRKKPGLFTKIPSHFQFSFFPSFLDDIPPLFCRSSIKQWNLFLFFPFSTAEPTKPVNSLHIGTRTRFPSSALHLTSLLSLLL